MKISTMIRMPDSIGHHWDAFLPERGTARKVDYGRKDKEEFGLNRRARMEDRLAGIQRRNVKRKGIEV